MDRVVAQAYQSIIGIGDLTAAQARQLFTPVRDVGVGVSSAELHAEPAMMACWASRAARVTARIGLACVDDLSAEVPGLRSAMSKFQAIRREAGDDPNDLPRLGTTATAQGALALSHVSEATQDLRDFVVANSKHRIAVESASGPGATAIPQLSVSNTPLVQNTAFQQAARLRLFRPVCATGSRSKKNRKRDGSDCGALLDKEGTHATSCPCADLFRQTQRLEGRARQHCTTNWPMR